MTRVFTSKKLLTNISNYLTINELLRFSLIDKSTYFSKLNPISNPLINSLYRFQVIRKLYLNGLDDYFDTEKEKEIIDDYNITQNDWRKIYIEIMHHFSNFHHENKKDYLKAIYGRFKDHLYLPFIRKSNIVLENKESSFHQLYFYDFNRNNAIISNHFDKYLDLKNNGFIGKDSDNFIIRKKLFFENEFLNFDELAKNVQENNNYIEILERIINYDYKAIDYLYLEKNIIGFNNVVLDFILWLNHTVILFSKFLHSQINIYCYDSKIGSENELIKMYTRTHDNFVNFSLSINEHFNNLNIIINYLYRFTKDKTKSYYQFSLYKMLFNIMKKEIYDKIKPYLVPQFKILVEQYCQELFENVSNERKQSFDSGTKPDSNDSFEEDDDLEMVDCDSSFNEENKEISKKHLLNFFMKCITDLSINEKNALAINHSNIKMDDNYLMYENILINSFVGGINYFIINEKKPIDNIFEVVKNLLSIKDEYYKSVNLGNYNGFNFIRRTKKSIFKKIEECLEKNLYHILKKDYCEFIENNNHDKEVKNAKIKKINRFINQNMKEIVDELDQEEKRKLEKLQEEEIDKIKNEFTFIVNSNKYASNIVNIKELIDIYFNNVALDYVVLLKEILYSVYAEKKLYSELDNKIICLLKNNNSINSNSIVI